MMIVPIIKMFPENHACTTALGQNVSLLTEPARNQIAAALNKHAARALIITPEYNEDRAIDADSDWVFHVLMEKEPIDPLALARLCCDIEDILDVKGAIVPFNRKHFPDLIHHFRITHPEESPVYQVFAELDLKKP